MMEPRHYIGLVVCSAVLIIAFILAVLLIINEDEPDEGAHPLAVLPIAVILIYASMLFIVLKQGLNI